VLDVRTPEEVAEGVIPGAIVLDYKSADFKTSLDSLDKSKTYFVYCASGGRSGKTADLMKQENFNAVYSLAGGMKAWTEAGLETVKP
jgi:phage shock protein E